MQQKPEFVHSPVDLGKEAWQDIQYQQERPPNWLTNIEPIDTNLKMLHEGRVIGIQASTSHGKSTMMLAIAQEIAPQLAEEEIVLFCTWEDSIEMFGLRVMARYTAIPLQTMYGGKLDAESLEKLKHAATKVQSGNFWVVGHSEHSSNHVRLTMSNIREAVDYIQSLGKKVKVVVLDYLQRISLDDIDTRFRGNAERTSECMSKVKDLSVDTRAMILIGTQVDRDVVKNRKEKMPQLGDAMWTSNFEHSCDAVISQYFPSKFAKEGEPLDLLTKSGKQIIVTEDLLLAEIQKQKIGKTPVLLPLSVDFDTGIISRWEQ